MFLGYQDSEYLEKYKQEWWSDRRKQSPSVWAMSRWAIEYQTQTSSEWDVVRKGLEEEVRGAWLTEAHNWAQGNDQGPAKVRLVRQVLVGDYDNQQWRNVDVKASINCD